MVKLQPGDLAPDFTLPQSGGGSRSLKDLRGHNVILFFYPRDNTPGCTKEACSFRDAHHEYASVNAEILGISPDSVVSHDTFAAKYRLPYALLADTDHRVAEAYGAWGEKTTFGIKSTGMLRTTFLIDPEGKIKKVWHRVKPEGHAADVLRAVAG